MFKVPDLFQWIVVTSGSKHIEDLYKAPDNVLSFMDAIVEVSSISSPAAFVRLLTDTQQLQFDYTIGVNVVKNPYHVPIVRLRLTQALPLLVPEVYDEVVMACNEFIPITEGNRLNHQDMFIKIFKLQVDNS